MAPSTTTTRKQPLLDDASTLRGALALMQPRQREAFARLLHLVASTGTTPFGERLLDCLLVPQLTEDHCNFLRTQLVLADQQPKPIIAGTLPFTATTGTSDDAEGPRQRNTSNASSLSARSSDEDSDTESEEIVDRVTHMLLSPGIVPSATCYVSNAPASSLVAPQPASAPLAVPTLPSLPASAFLSGGSNPWHCTKADENFFKSLSVEFFVGEMSSKTLAVLSDLLRTLSPETPTKYTHGSGDLLAVLEKLVRHPAIIAGVAKIPCDGLKAGLIIMQDMRRRKPMTQAQFLMHVNKFLDTLEHIELVAPFTGRAKLMEVLQHVHFVDGWAIPPTEGGADAWNAPPSKHPNNNNNGTYNGNHNGNYNGNHNHHHHPAGGSPPSGSSRANGGPAVNVRELHARHMCTACRHYLRGMCLRGDTCSFCHHPSHQIELEKSVAGLTATTR